MNILVTGGSGLIGAGLIACLNANRANNIYIISRTKNSGLKIKSQNDNIKIIEWDLINKLEKQELPDIHFDFIIHLAANSHSRDCGAILKYNTTLTRNLYEGVTGKFTNFIFFSSVAVYGEARQQYPICIGSPCKPSTYYGKSKLDDEEFLKERISKLVILRLCPMIDGANNPDLLKRVYIPLTAIKFRSPYLREYSFSSMQAICSHVESVINDGHLIGEKINLCDSTVYDEEFLLSIREGKSIRIPLFICKPVFFILRLLYRNKLFYKIECNLWKLLRINTYE
jgi:nucleoside-diphosphate-sugar epimerase